MEDIIADQNQFNAFIKKLIEELRDPETDLGKGRYYVWINWI